MFEPTERLIVLSAISVVHATSLYSFQEAFSLTVIETVSLVISFATLAVILFPLIVAPAGTVTEVTSQAVKSGSATEILSKKIPIFGVVPLNVMRNSLILYHALPERDTIVIISLGPVKLQIAPSTAIPLLYPAIVNEWFSPPSALE